MKILKKAWQKNLHINKEYYTHKDLERMLQNEEILYFKGMDDCYEMPAWHEIDDTVFRIYTENLKEIKVKFDEYIGYTNVAVGLNGKEYYISL